MTGGATAQLPYACRSEGCERGFLTLARRDAHEISDHGGAPATTAAPAPILDGLRSEPSPSKGLERIERELGGGTTVNEPSNGELCACGRPARHTGRHRGSKLAAKSKSEIAHGHGRRGLHAHPGGREKHSHHTVAEAKPKHRAKRSHVRIPVDVAVRILAELEGSAREHAPDPGAPAAILREHARRLELVADLREAVSS